MSWTKYVEHAHIEGLIRTLRTAGVISTDASADQLRNLNNGLTEIELQAIIDSLDYGAGGSGVVSSTEDLLMLIDSDGLPAPFTGNKNYFRVMRGVSSGPVNWTRELMSVYGAVPNTYTAEMVLGPDTAAMQGQAQPNTYFQAKIFLSAYADSGGDTHANAAIMAGSSQGTVGSALRLHSKEFTIEASSGNNDLPILFTYSRKELYSGNDTRTPPTPPLPTYLGGFNDATGNLAFFVGDLYDGGTGTNTLAFIRRSYGFDLTNNNEADQSRVNFTSASSDFTGIFSINADAATDSRNPALQSNATLTVFGPESTSLPSLVAVAPKLSYTNLTTGVLTVSAYDEEGGFNKYNLILARRSAGGGPPVTWNPVFRVNNLGAVYADGAYSGAGADVAECIELKETYDFGTVIVINQSGMLVASTTESDPSVMGVVAKAPGVRLGEGMESDPEKQPLTVCGFTPVKCTTAGGSIVPGNLLVSSTDGMAQKAPDNPAPGTILGKAMEALEQPGEEVVTGNIKVFVNLQ